MPSDRIARAAAAVVLSGLLARAPAGPPFTPRAPSLVAPAAASTRADLFRVGNDERCEMGTGEACERLADGNEYIRQLQEKTKPKRAEYEKSMFGTPARRPRAARPSPRLHTRACIP